MVEDNIDINVDSDLVGETSEKLIEDENFYISEYDSEKKDKTAFTQPGTYDLTIEGKKNDVIIL